MQNSPAVPEKQPQKPKKKSKMVVRAGLTVLLVAAGLFLLLLALRVLTRYESIPAMLRAMWRAVADVFQNGF